MKTITKQQVFGSSDVWTRLPGYEPDDPIPLDLLAEIVSDEEFVEVCCRTVLTLENPKTAFVQRVAPHTQQTNAWHVSQDALQQVINTELARQRAIILEICK
jgi:hypothetical protein